MRSKKAITNIIVSFIQQIVTIICGFIVPQLIIRKFGSNVNGLLSSMVQFMSYITLLESGFGPIVKAALYKPIAEKDNKKIASILRVSEKFFRNIAYIFLGYIIILAIFFPILMKSEFEMWYTFSLVLIISIGTFMEYYFGITYTLYLQAEQKTYITSGIQAITTILNAVIVVLLVKMNCSIQVVKLVSASIFFIRPIFQNLYVKKKYNINLKEADKDYKIEQKWDGLAQHIAYVIHTSADVTVLTLFSKVSEVSVYALYYMVVSNIKNIVNAFNGGIDASFGDMIAKGEKENLNKSFSTYELICFTIVTIIFSAAMLLIVPFIKIYTNGITDVNYYRPFFATTLVLSEFVWTIRQVYNNLIKAAGHFKQTMKGAWVEAAINIILSVILVFKFGISGVAIGTLVAMFIRTIEFMYHTSKYILDRSFWYTFEKIIVVAFEVVIVVLTCRLVPSVCINSYLTWAMQGVITTLVAILVVTILNFVFYKEDMKNVFMLAKRLLKKSKN